MPQTRSMSKAITEKEIKPDEMEFVYRKKPDEDKKVLKFSQTSTFKSKSERNVDGKVFGIENDLKYVKQEPNDANQKKSVCICQIKANLKKLWTYRR